MIENKRYAFVPTSEKVLCGINEPDTDTDEILTSAYMDVTLDYLGADGRVKSRLLRIYLPIKGSIEKLPIILSSHYELEQDQIYKYIKQGWTVATPVSIPPEHLQNISWDALRFSMACLDFIRRLEFVDPGRIALRGASAAGYHTIMLSATHLGINCAYDLYGGLNHYYEFRYGKYNNKFNVEFEEKLRTLSTDVKSGVNLIEAQKNNWTIYSVWGMFPIPPVKGLWDIMLEPVIKAQGEGCMDMDAWRRYSPITHLDEVCHPVLMFHSSADALVPFNALTERYAYQDFEDDLPAGFTINVNKLIDDEYLNKPMDEIVPEDMEIYRIEPVSKDPSVKKLRFVPGKKFCLNYVDEGKLNRKCDHFKDPLNAFAASEMDFMNYYLNQTAGMTNRLTLSKVKTIAKRYLGELELLKEENPFKKECDSRVFGSIDSDRLDVLLGIKAYLDFEYKYEKREGLSKGSINRVQYIYENLEQFMAYYEELTVELRFFDCEAVLNGHEFQKDPIFCLIRLIEYYIEKC